MNNKKPCPFCASVTLSIQGWLVGRDSHMEYRVVCNHCGARGPNDLSQNKAVEMWNLRRSEFPSTA